MSKETLILGTRGSDLALVQATQVQAALEASGRSVERKIISTIGDKRQDLKLSEAGGDVVDKGVFTKELEEALASGEIDLAVHSLKDVPTELAEVFCIAGVLPRAPTEDVLLARNGDAAGGINGLRQGAVVATSSVRRARQLQRWRSDLEIVDIRGNVPTRIRKLIEQSDLDAIMLARAGLERLGHGDHLAAGRLEFEETTLAALVMPAREFLPAASQGIVGIETRSGDAPVVAAIEAMSDPTAHCHARAEREFLRLLQAGCQTPVGVHSWVENGRLSMMARLFEETNDPRPPTKYGETEGDAGDPEGVAAQLIENLEDE